MTSAPHSRTSNDTAFWLPFTAQRQFQQQPMLFTAAQGMHYTAGDGRQVLDAMAGLWCCNAGHGQPRITEAIREAAGRMDFVSSFKMSHPDAFTLARRIADLAPEGMDHVFFTNSGSEAVDTALKIARAYHQARGDARRTLLVGRAKGYHGMGFGGLSVAGLGRHKRDFGPLLPDTAHLPLPYDADARFSRGQPATGAHYANALEQLFVVHDPATIAAVIVEPVTGSGGVYPPPVGYLQRLRELCTQHGILLIFDEVITGFSRVGAPFAAQAFGVTPDLMSCAKGMTNGAVPMGGVIVGNSVYEAFMQGPADGIELFHGYTYSAHPLACAAGLATLEVHEELGLAARVQAIAPVWQAALHGLRDAPHVVDVRNIGLLGAVELAPRAGAAGARAQAAHLACFESGVLVRNSGDTLVLSPPLVISEAQIGEIAGCIRTALQSIA
ncbi:Beta-alanine--pyruvate transaminase [Paracidovorax avenae ATCC 19860]|uniref:Beta-alanine--pyruvate transaminase n=1 Tax=Paracidovorax avenae (strain ATCC 19860 / DSM 7227 / CCUG 15838 / JCM 20985 / LMG 2117 / NCPPB 1011) TaxID=643561 RepID=F0QAV5_PARA1|nr:aminotransferase class III-fold pyridoxal phosphate-dependent enzyme [Paracidovorax avenae]ADX47343.1 Beta-alanine--pyruvate transaminase [Paracidovorax avenae ATCC 19860]